jgi:outer membrane protein insertion porin family
MFKFIYSFLLLIILNTNVMAVTISDIDVVNNDRVSKKTIINFSRIDITKDIQNDDINAIIKNLYETNFFSDVRVKILNNKLIITVTENKIVNSIIINGVKAEKFREAILDAIKLKEKSPFIEFLLAQDIKLINEALFSQGFYFSNVSSFISDNDNGTIDITYDVILGEKALLKYI